MRTMNRRNFLALAGAGSVAAATSVGADILSPRTAGAYNFRAVAALPTSSWWMVGTAEYHVTRWSRTVRQNDSGLNLPGTITVPPESSVDMVDATSP